LKSMGLREDSFPKPDEEDDEQLKMGKDVETDHTQDDALAGKIAKDHISDDPDYYSNLKNGGMADALPSGQQPCQTPMLSKLMSPSKVSHPSVIAVGVRGTKTGLLPAGGIVDDPEKARLGGLELVKNLKPNSQGAIANTPSSKEIKSDGGHYTPDNSKITKGDGPKTSKAGDDTIHPFQTQQLGNKPFEDDGTTRDGETTPAAAGGDGRCTDAKSSASTTADKQDFKAEPEKDEPEDKEEPSKGPWGIELDKPKEKPEEPAEKKDDEEGEDVEIDIKESNMKQRFQELANIKDCTVCGCGDPNHDHKDEKALNELKKTVERLKAGGKKSSILERAERYLSRLTKKVVK
jgi:hypothetical protein